MNFNPEQTKAIFGEEPLIVVSAGAGSGKTRVLTERYVRLCELKFQSMLGVDVNYEIGADVSQIVTLTFTEDAALEMKSRIRKRLMDKLKKAEAEYPENPIAARNYWKEQMESLDTAIISTFHSFCQRIVQENSLEANIYPNFQVLDEVQSQLLKTEIYSELLEEGEHYHKWQALLKPINRWTLQESLFSVYGKIREYEMSGMLRDTLNVKGLIYTWRSQMDQFEEDFYQFFSSNPETTRFTTTTTTLFTTLKAIYQHGSKGELFFTSLKKALESPVKNKVPVRILEQSQEFYQLLEKWLTVRDLLSYYELEHNGLVEPILADFEDFLVTIDEVYEQKKREAAWLDFGDLQQKAIKLMNNPTIQNHYSSLYKHFLVDEMQDTNQLQLRMIEKINPAYRFIVGDGKQSIYRFRGADVQIFNGLIHEAKENSMLSFIDMNTNYRTCDSIIRFINLLFEQKILMGVGAGEAIPSFKTEYSPMTANRNAEFEVENRVEYIKVSEEQETSQDQNQYIMMARRMVQLVKEKKDIFDKDQEKWRAVEWRDMAVLMASRTNLTKLELALKRYDIPYNVYGGLGFYERQEVVDYLSLLQWLNKPYEPLYIMAVLRGPLFGVTMDEFLALQDEKGDQQDFSSFIYGKHFHMLASSELQIKLETFCQFFETWVPFHWTVNNRTKLLRLLEKSGLKKVMLLQKNNLMKLKNVEKLIETINNLQAISMDDMLVKINILADLSKKEGDAQVELTGGNFVHIMTVHGSKGLEFPVVFVPNLSKGMQYERLPFRYEVEEGLSLKVKVEDETDLLADPNEFSSPNFKLIQGLSSDQALEESKRLFYVALTRARDLLILTSTDKGNKNTWYGMLEDALTNSHQLAEYVQIKEGVEEQKILQEFKEMYDGPKVKQERTIPISFSVSEVMSYLDDPEGFIEKHLLKLDELWLDDEEEFTIDEKLTEVDGQKYADPRTLGTLVH